MGNDGDSKNSKNSKLVLIKSVLDKNKNEVELSDIEEKLKDELIIIEDKLESIEKVITSINDVKKDTIYNSDAFSMLVGSIAITAAINLISKYFDVDPNEIDDFFK